MMPKRVSYVQKVIGISAVVLEGELAYKESWQVGEDFLEEWLERFDGKRVRLTLEDLGAGRDESHLLPPEQE